MGTGKLTKIGLPPSPNVVKALRDLIPVDLGKGKPAIIGYYDAQRRMRRIVANFPSGWHVRINLNQKGEVTSESAQLKMSLTARGQA